MKVSIIAWITILSFSGVVVVNGQATSLPVASPTTSPGTEAPKPTAATTTSKPVSAPVTVTPKPTPAPVKKEEEDEKSIAPSANTTMSEVPSVAPSVDEETGGRPVAASHSPSNEFQPIRHHFTESPSEASITIDDDATELTSAPTAGYIPPTDDSVDPLSPDDPSNAREWNDSSIEEMEHDRTVLIALLTTFALGLLLSIFVAQQLMQNPNGCCTRYGKWIQVSSTY